MAKSIDLAADASRRAALLLSYIPAVCAFVAPCPPGASTAIFDRLGHSRALTCAVVEPFRRASCRAKSFRRPRYEPSSASATVRARPRAPRTVACPTSRCRGRSDGQRFVAPTYKIELVAAPTYKIEHAPSAYLRDSS